MARNASGTTQNEGADRHRPTPTAQPLGQGFCGRPR
jgi:hypothetical protein